MTQRPDVAADPQPVRGDAGASVRGPRNPPRERQGPDLLAPPATDRGTVPNLRFAFADAHTRLEPGGWAREVTARELPVARTLAGVNMRLRAGAVRELHWHKQAEWAHMIAGAARVTAIDPEGRAFVDDVPEGGFWYFPAGIPHSIQALAGGCEFLLVFDDGDFSEHETFLLSDWLAHTPREVVAHDFGVAEADLDPLPDSERYIFPAPVPGPLADDRRPQVERPEESFTHPPLGEHEAVPTPGGSVHVLDTRCFPVARTVAAALVEVEPGGLRELHWHPNADEWQYVLAGAGRMTVFAASGKARTFDLQAGDVGYVPFAMAHYVENRGPEPLRFLELFRSARFADISLARWLALTPRELVRSHLGLDDRVLDALCAERRPVVSAHR